MEVASLSTAKLLIARNRISWTGTGMQCRRNLNKADQPKSFPVVSASFWIAFSSSISDVADVVDSVLVLCFLFSDSEFEFLLASKVAIIA